MKSSQLVLVSLIVFGAVLGLFLRPAAAAKSVALLVVIVAGCMVAGVLLNLMQQEWLLLLMGVPFGGALVFLAAVVMYGVRAALSRLAGARVADE